MADAKGKPPTVYAALRSKLGREPTNRELIEDVKRILHEGYCERADAGMLAHQKGR